MLQGGSSSERQQQYGLHQVGGSSCHQQTSKTESSSHPSTQHTLRHTTHTKATAKPVESSYRKCSKVRHDNGFSTDNDCSLFYIIELSNITLHWFHLLEYKFLFYSRDFL